MKTVADRDETLMIVAENCKRIRDGRSYGVTAKAMSDEDYKAYPATIQQIESGRHMPNAFILYRLAKALGATTEDLLAGLEESSTAS
jgi:transcriptional regulator with XRE-family HTH domain